MKTEVKKLEKSQVEVKAVFDKEEWKAAQDKALDKVAASAQLDGFRKGHAPKGLIKAKIGAAALQSEAVDVILSDSYSKIFIDNGINPVGQPSVSIVKMTADELELSFTAPVAPEFKLGEYKGLDVKKKRVRVTEKEINEKLEQYQNEFAELVIKEGEDAVAENGDTVTIDFEGFKDINVKFPEEYQAKDLAGADATFKVTVHEIKSKVLPELDDELAKDVNIDGVEDLEALKKHIKEQLKSSKEAEAEEAFNEEIIDKLIENTPFEVPDAMVETEVQNIISEINANLQQQGLTLELYQQMTGQTMDQLKADVRDNAEKRVKYQLIVAEIVKAENIEVSDEELAEEIKNIATYYGREEEEVKKIFAGQEDRIKEDVASRKAVDLVKENVAK